jgi:Ca-activated chloride channel family protein
MLSASLWLLFVLCQAPVDLRVNVPLVLIPVHVTNTVGTSVTNLAREDFRLFEDNVEQNVTHFSKEEAALSIGLLFDSSGSMRNKMKKSMAAVTTFFKTANAGDEFFLIEFNERPRLLAPFTRDLDDIRTRLGRVKPFGRTALFDAVRMALEEMKGARNSRKVILILSDGGDNRSRYTELEIKGRASESDSQIYSMGIFESGDSLKRTPEERNGPRLLNDLAEQTGGRHFPVNDLDDLPDICARISAEFRNQYVLGYSPANGAVDGKYRQVKVQVVSPQNAATLKVHHRPGYYAPDGAGW